LFVTLDLPIIAIIGLSVNVRVTDPATVPFTVTDDAPVTVVVPVVMIEQLNPAGNPAGIVKVTVAVVSITVPLSADVKFRETAVSVGVFRMDAITPAKSVLLKRVTAPLWTATTESELVGEVVDIPGTEILDI
jgi:hypothetical protein